MLHQEKFVKLDDRRSLLRPFVGLIFCNSKQTGFQYMLHVPHMPMYTSCICKACPHSIKKKLLRDRFIAVIIYRKTGF